MLNTLSDIAPKALVAGVVVWAAANYAVIGPEVASRVVRADIIPACELDIKTLIAKAGESRLSALKLPSLDPAKEMAMEQLQALQNNPMMMQLRGMSGQLGDMFGMDRMTNTAMRQYQQSKEAARQAYAQAHETIKQSTATELGKAGDVCGCLADAAISDTRTEWAIFSGTLGLIKPAPLKTFAAKMADRHRAGTCTNVLKAG